MRDRHDPARIGIIIYDGVEPIDVGGTAGVVSMATRLLPNISSVLIAEQAGPVKLAGGVTVQADAGFGAVPACDVLIVCGGPGWREQVKNRAMLAFLKGRPRQELASVCTGALILAAAGVLDGLSATTRRSPVGSEDASPLTLINSFAKGASPEARLIVDDGGVVTSGGVSLAIDGTLYLIGRIYGEDARDQVAKVLEYDRAFVANREALGIKTTRLDG